jgi:hypothetical protein
MRSNIFLVLLAYGYIFLGGYLGEAQSQSIALNFPAALDEPARAFGMPQADLDAVASSDFRLATVLSELFRQGIKPIGREAVVGSESPHIFVVPLSAEATPDIRLFLFFESSSGQVFFLQSSMRSLGEPEVRIWSGSKEEIIITTAGLQMRLQEYDLTRPIIDMTAFEAAVGRYQAKGGIDTLTCILRSLGVRLNFSSISSFFSSALCSQFSAISVGLTALNCLSIPAPAAIFGCINGVAKIISCGIASCATGGTYSGSVSDYTGDSGGYPVDLARASITVLNGAAQIEVHFASSSFKSVAWMAQLGLDVDQNPATGHHGVDSGGILDGSILGTEYIVNLEGSPAMATVFKNTGVQNDFVWVGQVSATLLGDGVTATIPLSMLGGDDGRMNFKVVSVVKPQGIRDVMPNVGLAVGHVQ